jgi:NADH-quinone oxidoreductase subunit F
MENSIEFEASALQAILSTHAREGRSSLLPVLLEVQAAYGYLPAEAAAAVGRALRVPLAEVHGVIEFYTMLYPKPVGRRLVRVCTSPMCSQAGSGAALEAAARHLNLKPGAPNGGGEYGLEEVPCLGLCDHAPAALVGEVPVGGIGPESAAAWIEKPEAAPLGFIGGTARLLSARCGVIDPTDLQGFIKEGGYVGLRKALQDMSPAEVVEAIRRSGLVGRGGAAFPTGSKWEMTASAPARERFVVCNADESEPGTFKDRLLMEGDPFSILEGITVAGYAIGAQKGYLYVRGEYPCAQAILAKAIAVARQEGWLGSDIDHSGFAFDVELRSGAGAYICGEETALFESIEGKRGFPRLKPPYPTTHGLFRKPTVINNVETLCAAAWIIANGVEAYRAMGTSESPGSKLFCLSGDIVQPGVFEVPFGTRLGDLIGLAGGVRGELQAVLLGGAAGAFAGPEQLELQMSFEGLRQAGLPLGSGVVMVINQERDLRQTLLSLAHFFAHESCGKCYPCQLGTQRQLELIGRVAEGRPLAGDIQALKDVGFTMSTASLCGLGATAGTAVLSAVERWPALFGDGGQE